MLQCFSIIPIGVFCLSISACFSEIPQPLSELSNLVGAALQTGAVTLENCLSNDIFKFCKKYHCVRLAFKYCTNIVDSLDTSWHDFCLANTRNCLLVLASSGSV